MSNRTRGLLIGAVSGAVLGAVLAWAVLSREETNGEETPGHVRSRLQASTGEWFRLGTSILQAGRQMADMVRLA